MNNHFNMVDFIHNLCSFPTRQTTHIEESAKVISSTLGLFKVPYLIERFNTKVPGNSSAVLMVDGSEIPCMSTAFAGGKIIGKESLVSSLIPSRFLIDQPNINFNPCCNSISLSNFYFAPSLAVSKNDVERILQGNDVYGEVSVESSVQTIQQILVGNTRNPSHVLFAHYDSIGTGAIDNASGVAVLMHLIKKCPHLLDTVLFVFDGNEELSYDFPTYWGHGYRVFEERHADILFTAQSIIAIDCVGHGEPAVFRDLHTVQLAFPIKSLDKLSSKICTIGADIPKLMSVYHSNEDTPSLLQENYLISAANLLETLLV